MSVNTFTKAPQPRPLDDVADIVSGYGFPKELQGKSNGDLPFFKVGDISAAWNSGQKKLTQAQHYLDHAEASSIRVKPFPQGTVVFAKIGEAIKLNRRAILGQPSIVDNNVMGLIPKAGVVDSNYLFYWSLMLRLGDISQATTVPSVRKSEVKQLSFPWIPLDQQKRIVSEIEKQFSRLDEAVANLKRVKASLKRYKASVLKAAVEGRLVETEAERARRERRSYETGAQLLQRILETRRSQWQGKGKYKEPAAPDTTKLPELPEGWVWASPEQLSAAEQYSLAIGPFGSSLKVSDYTDSGVPLVFVRNIRAASFGGSDTVFVSEVKADELRAHWVEAGDLLVTKMGDPPGDVCIYPIHRPPAVITADCIKLRLTDFALTQFFAYAIESDLIHKQILGITKGVAQLKVSLGRFGSIAFPLPPIAEQQRIVPEVDRRLTLLRATEAQVDANLQRADRLRQSILQKAFGGGLMNTSRESLCA